MQAIASFGGKYATMVVKHVCGFLIWPSKVSSGNFTYDYGVPEGRDLIAQFAESCAGVGVKLGLYYSLTANTYLNYPALKDPGKKTVQCIHGQFPKTGSGQTHTSHTIGRGNSQKRSGVCFFLTAPGQASITQEQYLLRPILV